MVTEKQLNDLQTFFAGQQLPTNVQLDLGSKIHDTAKFIQSHITVLPNNGDKPLFEVFYYRLIKLKEIISGDA